MSLLLALQGGGAPQTLNATPAIRSWVVPAATLVAAIILAATPATAQWHVPAATVTAARSLEAGPATQTWNVPAATLAADHALEAGPSVWTWVVPGALLEQGAIPVVPPIYSPAPQGGIAEGRGSERRRELARSIEEALEREEKHPEIQKPARTVAPAEPEPEQPEEVTPPLSIARSIEEAPATAERADVQTSEPAYVPQLERSLSGVGTLRGARHHAINGALAPVAGGEGRLAGSRRMVRLGSLQGYAIENPSPELMIAILTATKEQ